MNELKQLSEPVQITIIICGAIAFIGYLFFMYKLFR